ncbi:MAG: hypothetical protein LDL39_13305 [Magnetospirillum sp.]|nr:hypothetical protein [Magnetospirillum sp.]
MIRLLAVLALLLAASPAYAHKLKLFVTQEGTEISGKTYFAGGGAAAELDGQVVDAQGRVVATLRTDAEGRFRFTPPQGDGLRVRFESGDGHMAEAVLGQTAPSAQTANAAAPPVNAATPDVDAAIARQLTPLREQLDRMESRARLSDIVGGVGLIVGVFGVYAWVASRRGNKS